MSSIMVEGSDSRPRETRENNNTISRLNEIASNIQSDSASG